MNLIKLIEAVKKEPKIYKNLQADDDEYQTEWETIASKVGVTLDEAQHRWNTILFEYMEYLKGNDDCELAKYMDFLQPYLFQMIDDTTIDEEMLHTILKDEDVGVMEHSENSNEHPEEVQEEGESQESSAKETASTTLENITQKGTLIQIPSPEIQQEPTEENYEKLNAKAPLKLLSDKPLTPQQNPIEEVYEKPNPPIQLVPDKPLTPPAAIINKPAMQNESSSFSNLTSIELIFLGYAKQLQKMPLALQLKTKRKIADIMDEAELLMMEGL
ncbi:uncharacterized protein [Musca autumnalis]|uniref:uncharacterized protein n=1 Tax=Musca autumnalis TaxID=221902 RepID=UPI003CFB73B5